MIHGKQIHLPVHGAGKGGRVDFQGFVHEHVVVCAVRPAVSGNAELVAVLSEVQAAQDPVQLIAAQESLLDGAADFVNEVLPEMLHGDLRLFFRNFLIFLNLLAGKAGQKLLIVRIVRRAGRKVPSRMFSQVIAS